MEDHFDSDVLLSHIITQVVYVFDNALEAFRFSGGDVHYNVVRFAVLSCAVLRPAPGLAPASSRTAGIIALRLTF